MINNTSLRIGIGIGVILTVISIPFPFSFFPNWKYTNSDTLLLYKVVAEIFVTSLIAGIVLSKLIKEKERFLQFIYVFISFVLAYFLLQYGFDKIFKSQFYFPEPNTLHTPIGQLSKDILFWSSMGSSYWYNLFMGSIEIFPALLLLNSKTRLLGAFISLGVLLNVWAINMSFDITVKLLSSVLLIMSLFILSFSWRKLYLFFTEKEVKNKKLDIQLLPNHPLIKRIIKGSIIGLFCLEIFIPYIKMGAFNRDETVSRKIHGSFSVINAPEKSFFNNTRRIHFHSKGYLILENNKQEFKDYRMTHSISKNEIQLIDIDLNIQLSENNEDLTFKWKVNNENLMMSTKKIDLKKMPLSNDNFHWTIESLSASN